MAPDPAQPGSTSLVTVLADQAGCGWTRATGSQVARPEGHPEIVRMAHLGVDSRMLGQDWTSLHELGHAIAMSSVGKREWTDNTLAGRDDCDPLGHRLVPSRSWRPRRGPGRSWATVTSGLSTFNPASSVLPGYAKGGHAVACITSEPPIPPPILGHFRHTDRCTHLHEGMASTK